MRRLLLAGLFMAFLTIAGAVFATVTNEALFYNFDGDQVKWLRKNAEMPLETDKPALNGDVFITGAGSSVELTMNAVAGIRVFADSKLTLANQNPSNTLLVLESGSALLNIAKQGSGNKFELETPTSVALVPELAQFYVLNFQKPDKSLFTTYVVKKGRVTIGVKNAATSIILGEQQAIDVGAKGLTPQVRTSTNEEVKTVQQATGVYIYTGAD